MITSYHSMRKFSPLSPPQGKESTSETWGARLVTCGDTTSPLPEETRAIAAWEMLLAKTPVHSLIMGSQIPCQNESTTVTAYGVVPFSPLSWGSVTWAC